MDTKFHYTDERNVQVVIALLKAHGIKRVIASPGTTNMTFVVSVQNDSWFEVWSSVDERSAAYLACGMAAETGEPVVISCTGATASRNYMPGLTEAYYRKLPVLAITSTRGNHFIGHLVDQQIDRRRLPNDIAMESVTLPMVKDSSDERFCVIEANKAILALKLNGGGPVHINLYTQYSRNFSVVEIPKVDVIKRYTIYDTLPELPSVGRIAVFVGAHANFTENEILAIDRFCATNDAIVLCDHCSGYRGKYEVHAQIAACQRNWHSDLNKIDLCIHIGEVSGDAFIPGFSHVWRVSPDGELRDTWGKLRKVFMMPEEVFFNHYSKEGGIHTEYLESITSEIETLSSNIPELPFSNIWIAKELHSKLPPASELHLGIYHSLRSYNFFKLDPSIFSKCNVGGFGIDGGVSTMIGASLANPNKLFFGIFGDLAFFYDMNVVGNRHVGCNIRILLINNGKGNEFRNYGHPCCFLGEDADDYVAAARHFGNKSRVLVKHYVEDLGYEYLEAHDKQSFLSVIDRFTHPLLTTKPMLLEVFTETQDESDALEKMLNFVEAKAPSLAQRTKTALKNTIVEAVGANRIQAIITLIKG